MNMLVASTLNSLLFRRVATPQRPVVRVAQPAERAVPNPWAAETRPVVFRSEAFAEDLDEELAS